MASDGPGPVPPPNVLDQRSEEGPVCYICLEDLNLADDCELALCLHNGFHYNCIRKWLVISPRSSCPLCKQSVIDIRPYEKKASLCPFRSFPVPPDKLAHHNLINRNASEENNSESHPVQLRRLNRFTIRPPYRRPYIGGAPGLESEYGTDGELRGRRQVYRNYSFSDHRVANDPNRFVNLRPAAFQADWGLVLRARSWIRRELRVFEPMSLDETDTIYPDRMDPTDYQDLWDRQSLINDEYLVEYIIAILKRVDSIGGQAVDVLADFLGRDNARLFLHELRCYLRSPFAATELTIWDAAVKNNRQLRPRQGSPPRPASFARPARQSSSAGGELSPGRGTSPRSDESGSVEGRTPSPESRARRFDPGRQYHPNRRAGPLDDRSRAFWGLGR